MDDFILLIHILSAAIWIGTAVFFGYAGPRFRRVGGPAVTGWVEVALGAIPRLITPVALLTLLSGATLVSIQEEWGWDDAFVWIGIGVFLAVLTIGLAWNAPNMRRGLSALEAGDFPSVASAMKKVSNGGMAMIALLVFAEIAMVYRLGA